MGFSQADWQELQINLDRIRFGPRIPPRPKIHVPGLPDLDEPKRQRREPKPPPEPGMERYQQRLPGF